MTVDQFLEAIGENPNARIYHGVQLRDLQTYIELGHIASRDELFERGEANFTPFGSDIDDQTKLTCGGDVFANLVDQGIFSVTGKGLPNVYGPITLVFRPAALRNSGATQVTVRRRAIWTSDEAAAEVLDGEGTRALYDERGYARSGEIQIQGGVLQMADLDYVIVNPIELNGRRLIDEVATAFHGTRKSDGSAIGSYTRKFRGNGERVYGQLANWAGNAPEHRGDPAALPPELREWFDALGDWKYGNVPRFADYLSHGTLSRLRNQPGHLVPAVAYDVEYDEPPYDYGDDWLEEIFTLNVDEVSARDEIVTRIERAEFHLEQARLTEDAENRDILLHNAWDEYVSAVEDLNEWIESTKCRILNDRDEMHAAVLGSHDSEASWGMTAWADEYVPIEIPEFDLNDPEPVLIRWADALDYADQAPHI